MNLTFPAFGRGDFEGNDLKFEVGGFADGIDPSFVQDDARASLRGLKRSLAPGKPGSDDLDWLQSLF